MCGNVFKFHNYAPMLNSCCFSSLASAFDSIEPTKSANDIPLRIEESLKSKMGNHIDFANGILKNENKLRQTKSLS